MNVDMNEEQHTLGRTLLFAGVFHDRSDRSAQQDIEQASKLYNEVRDRIAHRFVLFLLCLSLAACGCAGKPRVDPPAPWYTPEPNLEVKAQAHRVRTMDLTNRDGLLLYNAFLPFTDVVNYRDSHNIADAPAWHGAMMMSLGLKMAVEPTSADQDDLEKLAEGLLKFYDITGIKGCLGRSYLADYTGPRLKWMETKDERPTKYWRQGTAGQWWRTGLAKGHFTFAMIGCGVPLILEQQGKLTLRPSLREKLKDVMLPAVRRFVDGGFRIRDFDGSFTEFGDLRPDVAFGPDWPQINGIPNGFNRAVALAILASAATHDPQMLKLYGEKSVEWADGIGSSLELLGEVVKKVGHSEAGTGIGKPSFSDMQLFGVSCFVIMLQENRREVRKGIHRGLRGLWEFMRYERNPMFTMPYYLARPDEAAARMPAILEDLRGFPTPQQKTSYAFDKEETEKVQPLVNRTTNTHYWKSSPFRRVKSVGAAGQHPTTGAPNVYSGQDYLLAYWMARYLNVL